MPRRPRFGTLCPLAAIGQGSARRRLWSECAGRLAERGASSYAAGVGMPAEPAEQVALGIDMMDCVLPTGNARNGCLFMAGGMIMIKDAAHARQQVPVAEACGCCTCRNFNRAWLPHLFLAREMLYSTLATIHNLWICLDRMRGIREAIRAGRLAAYLGRFSAASDPDGHIASGH